jgi:non-lysosomal glucosylceramidase
MPSYVSLPLSFLVLGSFLSPFVCADDTFNPFPAHIESPRDNPDIVLKRLTVSSDNKTPTVKNLDSSWVATLADRGEPKIYTKANSLNFAFIGMPVGGIGAGEIYLSGDGQLWDWDIFGTRCVPYAVEQGDAYSRPHKVRDPQDGSQTVVNQGFVVRTVQDGKTDTRILNKDGFSNVTFSGQYPIGTVDYTDPNSPVHVRLEAFSPYVPSNLQDSTYPATILTYTVENTSSHPVQCSLGGWMENATAINAREEVPVLLKNEIAARHDYAILNSSVEDAATDGKPPEVFDDFESGTYDGWKIEGDAFGSRPAKTGEFSHSMPVGGNQGKYFVDTFTGNNDKATGKLTSKSFVIHHPYLAFAIGGGNNAQAECVNLLVDGKIVRTATGQNDETLRSTTWDVKDLAGKTAQIQIVDQNSDGWGHILVDSIVFADTSHTSFAKLKDQPDAGEMALAMLDPNASGTAQITGDQVSSACLDAPVAASAQLEVQGKASKLIGGLHATWTLAPGEKKTCSFIVAWYFSHPLNLGLSTPTNRQYSVRFKSAADVVDHIATNFAKLSSETHAWRDAWYDSTLPYYFLDRTFLNTSTLATSTSYLLSDGRFYGYEGRYSCPGTCTHVWGYQQAMGYLFPDLEKAVMEKAEFVPGLGMDPQGGVSMRDEFERGVPVDGQAGIILRTYLAHRMSADDSFLKRNYASVKKATDFLIHNYDKKEEGILTGGQANTMDSAWFGKITWLSLHYQAALRAAAEMADANNDADYAKHLRAIADKGRSYLETQLFNGEYFIHQPDPTHPDSPGTYNGCPLEQLMGQNWAYQVGLGEIIDPDKALTALDSIWKYNYTTDVGIYRATFKDGRNYALGGEGGLIMCTFPKGGEDTLKKGVSFFSAYDNECWAGSEYEITAVMMWAGRVDKALAEVKTLQERHDGAKRNPWDECECGSHYSRSMASYGVFTAACGFEYNGPEGSMAFAPRVNPDNFKSAFTSADGWGSFSQKYDGQGISAAISIRYGTLHLKTLSLVVPAGNSSKTAKAVVGGKEIPVTVSLNDNRASLHFAPELQLQTGQSLQVSLN